MPRECESAFSSQTHSNTQLSTIYTCVVVVGVPMGHGTMMRPTPTRYRMRTFARISPRCDAMRVLVTFSKKIDFYHMNRQTQTPHTIALCFCFFVWFNNLHLAFSRAVYVVVVDKFEYGIVFFVGFHWRLAQSIFYGNIGGWKTEEFQRVCSQFIQMLRNE